MTGPGNVRQLSHGIERAVTLSTGEWIEAEDIRARRGATAGAARHRTWDSTGATRP